MLFEHSPCLCADPSHLLRQRALNVLCRSSKPIQRSAHSRGPALHSRDDKPMETSERRACLADQRDRVASSTAARSCFPPHHPPPLSYLTWPPPPATHRFPLMCKKHDASMSHAHFGGTPRPSCAAQPEAVQACMHAARGTRMRLRGCACIHACEAPSSSLRQCPHSPHLHAGKGTAMLHARSQECSR